MWDQECDEVIKQRKRALQKFRKTKTVLSFIEYKKRRAMAIKVINTKKREILDQFCSTINRFTNLIYVWNENFPKYEEKYQLEYMGTKK